MQTAKKIGHVDLNKQAENLIRQIENVIRDRWLDSGTAHGFRKELERKAAQPNVRELEALLKKVQVEVSWRKKSYGHHQPEGLL